jgi:hypothetical protein
LTPDQDEIDDDKAVAYTELGGDEQNDSNTDGLSKKNEEASSSLNGVISPTSIAFIVAVIISLFSSFQNVLLDEENIVNQTIFASSVMIGQTVKVMTIFVFGASLPCVSWSSAHLSEMIHVLLVIVKLLVYPVLGLWIVFDLLFQHLEWIRDPILIIMMLIHFAAPSGAGLLILSSEKGYLTADIGKSLTVQHLGALVTLTLTNAMFLFLISNYYQMNGYNVELSI